MKDDLLRCKISAYENKLDLVAVELDTGIERKNAEELVRQFEGHKYIHADIRKERLLSKDKDVLYIKATYPHIVKECSRPGERKIEMYYDLERSGSRDIIWSLVPIKDMKIVYNIANT